MARIRSIKPELRTSLTVAEWPREVRYFWVLLWGYLDDHGRGVDDARLIKADCFPLDDDLAAEDIFKWIGVIADTITPGEPAPICRYEVNGRRYLHATRWHDHQKPQHPKDSKIPPCPRSDCGGLSGSSHDDFMKPSGSSHEDVTPERGDVEGGVVGDGAGRGNAQGATLPGTALLDAYLARISPRPPREDVRQLTEVIDRLVAEKTPVDVLAEALERYREKTKYGPSILRRLVGDVVKERAESATGKSRGSARSHTPYRNPEDDSAYEGDL